MSLLFVAACGDLKFEYDSEQGSESEFRLGGKKDDSEVSLIGQDFFEEQLFPLMAESESDGGCASSGCHLQGDAFLGPPFFRIIPDDPDESWNWAAVRRNEIMEGEFAGSDAILIVDQATAEPPHESFSTWSNEEIELVEEWSELEE